MHRRVGTGTQRLNSCLVTTGFSVYVFLTHLGDFEFIILKVTQSVDHTAQNPNGAVKTRLHFFASPFRIIVR